MKYIAITVALLSSLSAIAQGNIEDGKKIFRSRCASCHAIEKKVVGPALKGVHERHDEKWLIDFVHSSQSMIKSGDVAAVALYNEYNKVMMPDHKDLSQGQIQNIIAYIRDEGEKNAVQQQEKAAYTPPYTKPYTDKNSIVDKIVYLNFDEEQRPLTSKDTVSWFVIGVMVIMLVLVLHVWVFVNQVMDTYLQSRKGELLKSDETVLS